MAEIFHIINRGVDRRKIFLDERDHYRFIHDLFEFNDQRIIESTSRVFQKFPDIASRTIERKPRRLLVNIYTFSLMPNHYHLLLSPRVKDGTFLFMKKLDMGYAKYFNKKYERRGTLFEGRYKSIRITQEAHFVHLPYYIHFNPLDLKFPEWRDRKLRNYGSALKFLDSYRWSSHLDYMGKKNFPSVTQREFLLEFFNGVDGYSRDITGWLRDIDLTNVKDVILE